MAQKGNVLPLVSQKEWKHQLEEGMFYMPYPTTLEVNGFPIMDISIEEVVAHPNWAKIEELWIKHWREMYDCINDFRLWFQWLIAHPPSALKKLYFDDYPEWPKAPLGSIEDLLRALPNLEEFRVGGILSELVTLEAPNLQKLVLSSGEPPNVGWKAVFNASNLKSMKYLRLRCYDIPTSSLTSIFVPSLEEVCLIDFLLDNGEFLEAAAHSGARLKRLDLRACDPGFLTEEDEENFYHSFLRHRGYWKHTTIQLPGKPSFRSEQLELQHSGLTIEYN